jgi:hypothetical protein
VLEALHIPCKQCLYTSGLLPSPLQSSPHSNPKQWILRWDKLFPPSQKYISSRTLSEPNCADNTYIPYNCTDPLVRCTDTQRLPSTSYLHTVQQRWLPSTLYRHTIQPLVHHTDIPYNYTVLTYYTTTLYWHTMTPQYTVLTYYTNNTDFLVHRTDIHRLFTYILYNNTDFLVHCTDIHWLPSTLYRHTLTS